MGKGKQEKQGVTVIVHRPILEQLQVGGRKVAFYSDAPVSILFFCNCRADAIEQKSCWPQRNNIVRKKQGRTWWSQSAKTQSVRLHPALPSGFEFDWSKQQSSFACGLSCYSDKRVCYDLSFFLGHGSPNLGRDWWVKQNESWFAGAK